MECTAEYTLTDGSGRETARGAARLVLDGESLTALPRPGGELYYSLRDILGIEAGDYRIRLRMAGPEELLLSGLGFSYEDFLHQLYGARNELILQDLLMAEKLRRAGVTADLARYGADGREMEKSQGEVRLYETALVVLPQSANLVRIPYSEITESKAEDYRLSVVTEIGERLDLTGLGYEYEALAADLARATDDLAQKAFSLLKELAPRANPAQLRKVARYFKEGRAARRADLEADCPELWPALRQRVIAAGAGEEYAFLEERAQTAGMRVGFKRGLMGELTGDYFWFLFPLYGADPRAPGNAVAMEAVSDKTDETDEQGRATYFFRLAGRREYADGLSLDALGARTEALLPVINRCLVEINFRREPIYLSEEQLAAPEHRRYWFTMERLPALRLLRESYIGRVAHVTPEKWREDAADLLRFNVTAKDETQRWRKE